MQGENTSMTAPNDSAELPETMDTSARRRIVGKSESVAVTTQEAIDGYREKTRRIANVEQIELGNIMELSITGQLIREARRANLNGEVSLCKANGWNMKNLSHLKIARRLREKIHPVMLVVTIRKDEERGICSATWRELWRIIKDQIKDQTVVVIAISKHSAIWRRTELRSVIRRNELKYVDVGEMRVITNSKHEAELYAAALGASELKGIISLMKDLGYEKRPVLAIDAKATEHILHRQGLGKLKHIDVAYLWIQDEVRSRRLQVRRVKSEDNIADLGTKPLSRAVIAEHCATMGYMSMNQEDVQMRHQPWGCLKTLNRWEAGDHVAAAGSKPRASIRSERQITIEDNDEDQRAGWGTRLRTIGRSR